MNMPGAWAIRARSESATARLCFTPIMDKGSTQRDPAAAEEREAALAAREAAVAEREAAVSVPGEGFGRTHGSPPRNSGCRRRA